MGVTVLRYCRSKASGNPPLATTVTQFSPGGDDVVTRSHESLSVNPLPVAKAEGITTMEGSRQSVPARPGRFRKARSSLVRRLIQARDDPAKQRIRRWLSDIDDERLLSFGLTPEDIALLRGSGGSGNFIGLLRMGASSLLSVPSPPGSWF
jgi:hypothetical protein